MVGWLVGWRSRVDVESLTDTRYTVHVTCRFFRGYLIDSLYTVHFSFFSSPLLV